MAIEHELHQLEELKLMPSLFCVVCVKYAVASLLDLLVRCLTWIIFPETILMLG